jgi:predicted RNase H-like nuclease (RuvC/YqgF family)
MICSCYQLIPGASQPLSSISSLVFILQFIGLDVGGLGLNKAAQQQGLLRLSYARVIAYILIGITLVTVAYAGIEHAVQMDAHVTAWMEVCLVVARSIMTVLYGQAIHSLKHQGQSSRERIEELEQEVSSLRVQMAQRQHEVDTLAGRVDSGQAEVDRRQQQASGGQAEMHSLSQRLQAALSEVDGLRAAWHPAAGACSGATPSSENSGRRPVCVNS